MAVNLSIKEVPDAIAMRLRERAARNHRSLQGELMAIIERAVEASPEPFSTVAPRGREVARRGTKTVGEVAAELHALYPEPVTGAPRSVDIVRQMRDSR